MTSPAATTTTSQTSKRNSDIPLFTLKERRKIMNDKIAKLLNEQINKEFYSAYLYLDISNYYDEMDLDG